MEQGLSRTLWRERELLDMLVFKLDEQLMLLETGRERWLAYASREVGTVATSIREAEVLRATQTEAVVAARQLPERATLRELATACDEPWTSMFADHRDGLLAAVTEVEDLVRTNQARLRVGDGEVGEHRLRPAGGATQVVTDVHLRELAHDAAQLAAERAVPESLREFLR